MDRWLDQVAVVTGASAGIGAEVAKKLVQAGVNVVGLARRIENIEELANELADQPAKLHAVKCDLSKEEDILAAFDWIKANVGPISILVNNAGIIRPTTLIDGDTDQWRQVFDVNVFGLCICTREALKSMKEAEIEGHIVHLNSVVGHQVVAMPEPIMNVYPATKFAVTALGESLRQDLRHFGTRVKVTSISPGVVSTEFQDNFADKSIGDAVRAMPHLTPEDVANAVLYVLGTPPHVQVTELTVRPLGELF